MSRFAILAAIFARCGLVVDHPVFAQAAISEPGTEAISR
jgi:hypothetical protein